jgi:transposase-like protein
MPEQRRSFSPQFKAEAVQMVLETGTPIAEVVRDLGINEGGTLGNWVNIWRRDNPEPVPDASPRGARPREGNGRRDPPAPDGERVPENGSHGAGGAIRWDENRSPAEVVARHPGRIDEGAVRPA